MELYVFDKEINLIHVIDNFTSLIWTRRYYKTGEFELHIALTDDNIKYLKSGNIIYKKGDTEAGYVETRQIELNDEGNETLIIKGKFLTNYSNRRINWGQLVFNGTSENLMRKLVNDNCINPGNINRKMPLLELGQIKNFTESIQYQNSYGNILTELENIATVNEIGYRINLNHIDKKLIFEVYKGVNRSVNQSTIAPCIFSRDFENILNQIYTESRNNYRNTALIAGEGEGPQRVLSSINNNSTGLERYELFVDARDLRKEADNKTLSDTEYQAVLIQRGNEKLSEYTEIKTFESKVNTQGNNVYKVDYDLGDIITIADKKWGIKLDARITEIEEVYEGGKVEINPTFGNSIPTIIDKMKRMVK